MRRNQKRVKRDYIYIYYRADNARMICGRNAAGRRRWNGPTESAHRVTLCPVPIRSTARATPAQIRSAGTRTPSGPPISSPKRTNRARISSPRSPPERPPNRPPAALDPPTIHPAAWLDFCQNSDHPSRGGQKIGVKKSSACDYCINGMSLLLGMPLLYRNGATHGMSLLWRHIRAYERNSPKRLMPSLRGAAPTQKTSNMRSKLQA